jgi:hypothetical protein
VTEVCVQDLLLGKGSKMVRGGEGCWMGIIGFNTVMWGIFLELYRIYM